MERITIQIPTPTLTIKIRKTSQNGGQIEIGEATSMGELITDTKRRTGGKL